ncbi:MAG TPA: hypothetical protein VGD74_07345, partial [Vulgatibacter sp.]
QAAGVAALHALSALDGALTFPGVHVHILNPHWPSHQDAFDVGADREELDFDRMDDAARDANVLTIQVQYWFELKIPFADWMIWHAWTAARSGLSATGSISDPGVAWKSLGRQSIVTAGSELPFAGAAAALAESFHDDERNRGAAYRPLRPASLQAMLASGLAPLDRNRRGFFIPIVAHHSMRMQSNFHSRFIRDCSCFEGAGCSSECKAW